MFTYRHVTRLQANKRSINAKLRLLEDMCNKTNNTYIICISKSIRTSKFSQTQLLTLVVRNNVYFKKYNRCVLLGFQMEHVNL